MRRTMIPLLLLAGVALMACSGDDDRADLVAGETAPTSTTSSPATTSTTVPPAFVRGELVLGAPSEFTMAYPGGVTFGPGAHAVVRLDRLEYMLADGPSEPVAEVRIDDVDGFPIAFEFPDIVIQRVPGVDPEYEYPLDAYVYLGDLDDQTYIGDLMVEYRLVVLDSTEPIVAEVTGLERCGTGGGYCTDLERPR